MRQIVPRRRLFVFSDQATSSLTTLAFSFTAARNSDIANFGAFAVGYSALWLLTGTFRSILGELDLLTGPEESGAINRQATVGFGLAGGSIVSASLTAALLLILPAHYYVLVVAFAAAIPLTLAADAARYIGFVLERPHIPQVIDAVWLIVTLVPLIASILQVTVQPYVAVLTYGAGAALGLSVATLKYPETRPSLRKLPAWFKRRSHLAIRLLGDFLASSGLGQLAQIVLSRVANLAAVGAIRGGNLLLGPFNVALSGVIVVLIPHLRAQALLAPRKVPTAAVVSASSSVVLCGMVGIILQSLPTQVGEFILGDAWQLASRLIVLLAFTFGLQAASQIAVQLMRVHGAAGRAVFIRLFATTAQSGGLLYGGWISGALGAALGSTIGSVIGCVAWWCATVMVVTSTPFHRRPNLIQPD